MKKGLFTLSLFLLTLSLFSSEVEDSTRQFFYAYQFDENYFITSQVSIDTTLDRFQIYNPVYLKSISSTYLGNLGLASQNNVFIQRWENDYIFLNPFSNYIHQPNDFTFYHTRKPYTNILYTNGGSGTNLEQTISFLHTQNINENINIGLKYNLYSSLGQYIFQKAKHNSFSAFTTYRKKKYSLLANASMNKLRISENGGIVSDSLLDGLEGRTSSVNVNLMNLSPGDESLSSTLMKTKSLLLLNKYTFTKYVENDFTDSTIVDSITSTGFFTVSHMFKLRSSSRNHYDDAPKLYFYEQITDSTSTNDSSNFRNIVNSLRFEFHETKDKKRPGIILALNHEWDKYTFRNYYYEDTLDHSIIQSHGFHDHISINPPIIDPEYNTDTVWNYVLHKPNFKKYVSNTSVSLLFYKNMSDDTKWSIFGNYFLMGYKEGDYNISGTLIKGINSNSQLKVKGSSKSSHPSYVYQQFSSDHHYWNNNFDNIKKTNTSLYFSNTKFKISALLSATLISNHIYLEKENGTDSFIVPKQLSEQVLILTSVVGKDISFWNIRSNSQFVYQKMPNQHTKFIPLPEFIFQNSTYFDRIVKFKITNGELRFQLGFDLYYHSRYLAQDYNPALGLFHLQDENKEIGNYPFVDVFLNLRVKRALFFLKYEHVNSGFSGNEFFTALHYPMNWRVLRMGLSWRFDN